MSLLQITGESWNGLRELATMNIEGHGSETLIPSYHNVMMCHAYYWDDGTMGRWDEEKEPKGEKSQLKSKYENSSAPKPKSLLGSLHLCRVMEVNTPLGSPMLTMIYNSSLAFVVIQLKCHLKTSRGFVSCPPTARWPDHRNSKCGAFLSNEKNAYLSTYLGKILELRLLLRPVICICVPWALFCLLWYSRGKR